MKKLVLFIIIAVAAISIYLYSTKSTPDLMLEPDILKFAKINAELSIEFEHCKQDSILFVSIRDSIFIHFGVDEQWMGLVTDMVNQEPELWDDIYELMIKHTEMIKDSLLHKKPLPNDSILSDSVSVNK